MLEAVRSFFSRLSGGEPTEAFGEGDYRLAAAALLVHALTTDGKMSAKESRKLHAVLKQRFALDDAGAAALIAEASVMEGEAVDIYHFTRLLNRTLDEQGRLSIVEMMWEMAYADGRVNEFEDNLLWRASDLLGISTRDRMLLRHRVAAETRTDPRELPDS